MFFYHFRIFIQIRSVLVNSFFSLQTKTKKCSHLQSKPEKIFREQFNKRIKCDFYFSIGQ